MTHSPPETEYGSGSLGHLVPTERDRLGTVERLLDPFTVEGLAAIRLEPDARCLELGGGAGSIAYHLAGRVPRGEVVVTDIDTRFLEPERRPNGFDNLRIVVHDLRHDPCPGPPFDLVHCRAVLDHLPERERIVRSLPSWVRPGGHALLECLDSSAAVASPHPPLHRMLDAISTLMAKQTGGDFAFGRRLASLVHASGFVVEDVTFHPLVVGDGGPGEVMLMASIAQIESALVGSGALRPDDVARFAEWVREPGACDVYGHLCSVRARRPDDLR
ncbi:methyltransferase domain-containing protein [Actinomycetes bacterium KLBMP 9759]